MTVETFRAALKRYIEQGEHDEVTRIGRNLERNLQRDPKSEAKQQRYEVYKELTGQKEKAKKKTEEQEKTKKSE